MLARPQTHSNQAIDIPHGTTPRLEPLIAHYKQHIDSLEILHCLHLLEKVTTVEEREVSNSYR